jgi:hypothetical protein
MRLTTNATLIGALALMASAGCLNERKTSSLNQPNPIVPGKADGTGGSIDLAECTGGACTACGEEACGGCAEQNGNCGTQIVVCDATSGVHFGDCVGGSRSVTIDLSLESTGAVDSAEIWFYVDGPNGAPETANHLGTINPQDWVHDGRDKFSGAGFSLGNFAPGTYSAHICAVQSGAQGRNDKCTCSAFTLTVPDCGGGGGGACLTRTAGFWCNHPAAAANFLPVSVCGQALGAGPAGSCNSAVEALGSTGTDFNGFPQRVQLTRQLTTAKLNLAVNSTNGGDCSAVAGRIAECEALLCGCSADKALLSGCIQDLDAFNNSGEGQSLASGKADSSQCHAAKDNGILAPGGAPNTCNP